MRFLILSSLISLVVALPKADVPNAPNLIRKSALPTRWYHKRDHHAHDLFRRQETQPPQVGTPGEDH